MRSGGTFHNNKNLSWKVGRLMTWMKRGLFSIIKIRIVSWSTGRQMTWMDFLNLGFILETLSYLVTENKKSNMY